MAGGPGRQGQPPSQQRWEDTEVPTTVAQSRRPKGYWSNQNSLPPRIPFTDEKIKAQRGQVTEVLETKADSGWRHLIPNPKLPFILNKKTCEPGIRLVGLFLINYKLAQNISSK